jgi:hypothetical protein
MVETTSPGHSGLIIGIVIVVFVAYLLFHRSSPAATAGGASAQEFGPTASDASIAASQEAGNQAIVGTVASYLLGEQQTAAQLQAQEQQTAAGVTESQFGLQLGEQGNSVEEELAAEEAAAEEYVANQQRSAEVATGQLASTTATNTAAIGALSGGGGGQGGLAGLLSMLGI